MYIIIGIVILSAIGGVIWLMVSTSEDRLITRLTETQEVSNNFDPVISYIESCIDTVSFEGLTIMGERGGYIDPRDYLNVDDEPTSTDAVLMANNWPVPYYFSLRSPNGCVGTCEFMVVPETQLYLYKSSGSPSVEGQLEDYVEENLKDCLGDFKVLKDQGFEINEVGDLDVTVKVTDADVVFSIDYPIEASLQDQREEISRFFVREPLKLKRIWNIASTITRMQTEYKFLERLALNLIAANTGLSPDKLPPFSAMRFDFASTVQWQLTMIKDKIKGLLAQNIQFLKVYGTKNYQEYDFPGNEFKEAYYNEGMTLPGNITWNDLTVNFDYLGWDPYLDLNCDGETCKPTSTSIDLIMMLGFQQYDFAYDLSFPVLVSIEDETALNDRGFSYNFFLESNIRNNDPMPVEFVPIEPVPPVEESMVCDENKRNSGEISIDVTDISNEPLADVQVSYTCGVDSCYIGSTDAEGKLTAKFPICFGGVVSFLKQDYIGYYQILSTDLDKEDSLEVEMTPILNTKITVKKALLDKNYNTGRFGINFASVSNPLNLTQNESAMVTLERIATPNEKEFTSAIEYYGGSEPQDIRLAPGEYSVKIDLIYYGDVVIPEETRIIGGEPVTFPRYDINDTFLNGGLYYNYTFTTFNMEKGDITFIAVSPNIPYIPEQNRQIEDLEQLSQLGFWGKQLAFSLQPRFGR